MSDKDEIFNYVINTPENTNPAILRGMLDNLSGGSGGAFIVNATVNFETGAATLDKTLAEIGAAAEAGSYCVAKINHGKGSAQLLSLAEYDDDSAGFGSALGNHVFTLSYDNKNLAWTYYEVEVLDDK